MYDDADYREKRHRTRRKKWKVGTVAEGKVCGLRTTGVPEPFPLKLQERRQSPLPPPPLNATESANHVDISKVELELPFNYHDTINCHNSISRKDAQTVSYVI